MIRFWRISLTTVSTLLILCVIGPVEHDDTKEISDDETSSSSETVAIVYNEKGRPATGVKARFYSVNHSPSPLVGSTGLIDSAVSAGGGIIRLGTLPSETYNIEYQLHGELARRDSIVIDKQYLAQGDTLRDTLKAPGGLRGVVRLEPYHDARKAFIVLFGSDLVITPSDSLGNFELRDIAAGQYDAHIITLYEDYGVLDTNFVIRSGEMDTIRDTLKLPFLGLSPIERPAISYDTSWQVANLSWSPHTAQGLAGYHVYLTGPADHTVCLTPKPVFDTLFADTIHFNDTLIAGGTYKYRVCAVDYAGKEGPFSSALSIVAVSLFDSIGAINRCDEQAQGLGGLAGIAMGPDSNVYVCACSQNRILVYDRSGEFRFAFGDTGSAVSRVLCPHDIAFGPDSTVYVAEYNGHRIHRFTAQGEHISVFGGKGAGEDQFQHPRSIAVNEKGRIYVLDEENRRIAEWDTGHTFLRILPRQSMLRMPKELYIADNGSLLLVDFDGGSLFLIDEADAKFHCLAEDLRAPNTLSYDAANKLVYVGDYLSGDVIAFRINGERRWRYQSTTNRIMGLASISPNEFWVGNESRIIRCRRR
ncbi:MAG: hypothetical protein GF344_16360 [Chitinivibrionales bacterium]|nr:hypothetical protein [Chitinivibrionales bacterium]MBD3358271.1 hypothetical protein [Chitinivibrionales bacterium]